MFHISLCLWDCVSSTQKDFRRSRVRPHTYGSLAEASRGPKFAIRCRSVGTTGCVDVVLGPCGQNVCPICFPSPAKIGYFPCQSGGCMSGRIQPRKLQSGAREGNIKRQSVPNE